MDTPQTDSAAAATAAAPAAPAKPAPKVDTVVEYVLGTGEGDSFQAVFSDSDGEIVDHHRKELIRAAIVNGHARPSFSIVERTCTYKLDSNGRRQSSGSSCSERRVV